MMGPRCVLGIVAELDKMSSGVNADHVESVVIVLPVVKWIPIFHRAVHVLSPSQDTLHTERPSRLSVTHPSIVINIGQRARLHHDVRIRK